MLRFDLKSKKFSFSKKQRFVFTLVTVVACLLLNLNFSWAITTAKHYNELKFPPLSTIKLPKYERYILENGLVVYLMEDHELPLVTGTAMIRTGSRWEQGEKAGLASLVGSTLRSGGTQKHSANELNEILEQRAASVETDMGETAASASFEALSEDIEMAFGLFTEVLREPAFAPEKLDLEKTQIRGAIARRNDNPNSIASRELRKLIYGKNSPYARTVEYATLDKISRDDLLKFYQQYFHPNNIILGIVGDFNPQKMRSLIQAKFGDWKPNSDLAKIPLPQVTQANLGGVYFVNQPQLTQSSVLIGHLGGQFDNPDYPALDVMNDILNGFGGRLFNELRSRQGLAYSVYGIWNPRFDYPGTFVAGGQTRTETTVQFIKSLETEIKRLQTQTVTTKELNRAKDSTLNSFVFNFQDPSQTLSRLMRYEYYGYPADFLFRYQKAINSTTVADVKRVAGKYLKPENLVTLVVGNQKSMKSPLTNLAAKMTTIDITIPNAQPTAKN
ncbi:pitrilysin family protein [Aphanizomenon flos-aquae NRERC-008]|jgi:zinc protease|uniref:Insulinase family protein n=2 Tax=Aphanizomenon flos-aquae TaxID=1176 RepID=A0ABR8IUX4_APHFL|nr:MULTISPECIES: pitrilysin family protein [Aphanizomenon]MBD1216791.1 insulinase family protein [Aphanizomenon flos-aquae Clear-A1]MBO1062741.1 insulinase family protein [Aphanizomenon flos-aquae CP01]MDJ0506606.1 pitrilysin family protein [Nostocales cyanobacterium LE14-WE12]QSV66920.1 MAG: insulinase family protein [Aphanizomenon flos-aquae DEX188]MBD2389919.1 insulinase family protein [Aphanizomenon flos-aquae FACHB-1171]